MTFNCHFLVANNVLATPVVAITNTPNATNGGSAISANDWKGLIFSTPSWATSEISSIQLGLNCSGVGCGYPQSTNIQIDLYSVASELPNTQLNSLTLQPVTLSSGQQMYTFAIPNWLLTANTAYALVLKSDSNVPGLFNFRWGNTGNAPAGTQPSGFNGYTYLGLKSYSNGVWTSAGELNAVVIYVYQQPNFIFTATNQNQLAVATGLNTALITPASTAGQSILNRFVTMTVPQVQAVFDSISGAGISAQQTASFDATNITVDTVRRQGAYWLMDECQAGAGAKKNKAQFDLVIGHSCANNDNSQFRSWAAGVGGSNSLSGSSIVGSASVSTQTGGGLIGFDYEIGPNLLVGAMAGATSTSYNVSALASSGSVVSGQFGLYSVAKWNKFYLNSIFDFGYFSNSSTRYVAGIGPTTEITSHTNSNAFTGRLEVGYRIENPLANMMPFIAIQATSLQMGHYNESNTNHLGLSVQSKNVISEQGSLGVQVDKAYNINKEWSLYPLLRMAWIHEFQTDRTLTGSFQALPTGIWTVNGASAASDSADLGISLQVTNKDGFVFFASGNTVVSSTNQGYTGQIGLKIIF